MAQVRHRAGTGGAQTHVKYSRASGGESILEGGYRSRAREYQVALERREYPYI